MCNAYEGEPGTFKDRLILEGDPHSLIEAMEIAGYAIGSNTGYMYIRGEYTLSIERMHLAIEQAKERGFLGENILGTGFSFDIEIRQGAGSYVCGEETALISSIEGKRGEPFYKPPYPTDAGLWGKPTLINNVETLANIPLIIMQGGEWFRKIGTANSPGTKVFTLTGNMAHHFGNPYKIELQAISPEYYQYIKQAYADRYDMNGAFVSFATSFIIASR